MISGNSFNHQCSHPTGSIPLLYPEIVSIALEISHINPESSASLLLLSEKPNPPTVRPLLPTPITISPTIYSLIFPTMWCLPIGNMCHFSPVSYLNCPFNVTMMCERCFFFHFSSQNFNIPFRDFRKTYSPYKTLQKSITTAASKKDIFLLLINPYFLHYLSHPYNKSLITSLVTPKSYLLITPIPIFKPLINFPNHVPLMYHTVS